MKMWIKWTWKSLLKDRVWSRLISWISVWIAQHILFPSQLTICWVFKMVSLGPKHSGESALQSPGPISDDLTKIFHQYNFLMNFRENDQKFEFFARSCTGTKIFIRLSQTLLFVPETRWVCKNSTLGRFSTLNIVRISNFCEITEKVKC